MRGDEWWDMVIGCGEGMGMADGNKAGWWRRMVADGDEIMVGGGVRVCGRCR